MNKFCFEMGRGVETVESVNATAKQLNEYLHFCATHVKLALFLFFGSLILVVCIWVGTYFWYKHVSSQVAETKAEVAEAKLELAQANAKLKNKPLFLPGNSGVGGNQSDYVRVVPNSEATMTHKNGKEYPGVYAKVWYQDK